MIARLVRALTGTIEERADLPEGVVVVRGRWVPALGGLLSGMRASAAATTLGNTIVVHPSVQLTDRLLRHELEHVRQWRRQPFTFPLQYVWNHVRFGYEHNPFEVEARLAERGSRRKGGGDADHGR
jgi:hypothetical protein